MKIFLSFIYDKYFLLLIIYLYVAVLTVDAVAAA